jgi:hypothetical protein
MLLLANSSNTQRLITGVPESVLSRTPLLLTSTDGWNVVRRQPPLSIQVLALTSTVDARNELANDFIALLHNISGIPASTQSERVDVADVLPFRLQSYLAQAGARVDRSALVQFEQKQFNETGIRLSLQGSV